MQIFSPFFNNNEQIPEKYTCDGEDVSPPLLFEDIPGDAVSLTLLVIDPDAPGKTFTHWVIFNIDPEVRDIDEEEVPEGSTLGMNDFGRLEYGGPCPPAGEKHRYIFKLFALDSLISLEEGAIFEEIEQAMEGHILETAEIIAVYQKT